MVLLLAAMPLAAAETAEVVGRDGAPMVLIPAGPFPMGSEEVADEEPIHEVELDAFYLDRFEVTTARYAKFLEATGIKPPRHWEEVNLARDGRRPVVGVSWDAAAAYCRWVGKRLPTEAEWEKAARGTDGRRFPWGNEPPTAERGNFGRQPWKGYETLHEVGSHPLGRSPYGVEDMAGNAWEWVADWYDVRYYGKSPKRNPPGPADGVERVVRGGGWNYDGVFARAADRNRDAPDTEINTFGFRCATDAARGK
jgi:formylglycine-generating enzyme required for sulfatase activity